MEQDQPQRHVTVATPLGDLLVAARGEAVVGAYFAGQKHCPDAEWFGSAASPDDNGVLGRAARELTEYFAGERQSFGVPVRPEGTDFQQRVWERLMAIPFGVHTTYGSISAELSPDGVMTPGLAQGVGQAVGHNPISIIVPCHRVLGSDGSLTGFAGGLDRKRWLLAHEEPASAKDARLF